MSELTVSPGAAYLPESIEEVEVMKPTQNFMFFPYVLGAIDATLVPIHKLTDRSTNNAYYSGKHHCHGAKIHVVVDSLGETIHASSLISGWCNDSILFGESGIAGFFKVKKGNIRKILSPKHYYLLANSG